MSRLTLTLFAALPLAVTACSEQADRVGEDEGYQGGDQLAGSEGTAMSPAASALMERFDLAETDLIIAPTTYRAQGDLSSGGAISAAVMEEADPGYLRVSGSADPDAVLDNPGLGLSYRLSEDRAVAYSGQTVIVTLVVRAAADIGEDEDPPAIRAAWVAGPDANSGWQDMVLTSEWQKAVFTYDIPEDAEAGPDHIVILPPQGLAFDLAAVAVRPSVQ